MFLSFSAIISVNIKTSFVSVFGKVFVSSRWPKFCAKSVFSDFVNNRESSEFIISKIKEIALFGSVSESSNL
jgi:hypothetical protein